MQGTKCDLTSRTVEPTLQYKSYCNILTNVIKQQKKMYYDELISKSKNKTKTTWKFVKKKKNCQNDIKSLKINKTITNNP